MAWSTTREDLIRQSCIAVNDDTVNWTAPRLQGYWDTAFYELKKKLCPPFDLTQFNLLNTDNGNAPESNRLIALAAAVLVYEILPGKTSAVVQRLKDKLDQQIEDLQSGDSTLFDSAGTALTTLNLFSHNRENISPSFSTTLTDTSGNLIGNSGSLDQFAP